MSSIVPTVVGVLSSTGAVSAVALCVRQYLRYRSERERWRSTERLAERHGLEALIVLPQLARELRDRGPGSAAAEHLRALRRVPPPA